MSGLPAAVSPATREWMQVMESLRVVGRNVCEDDLRALGLSGQAEALRELSAVGLVRCWGAAGIVYYEMLWDEGAVT